MRGINAAAVLTVAGLLTGCGSGAGANLITATRTPTASRGAGGASPRTAASPATGSGLSDASPSPSASSARAATSPSPSPRPSAAEALPVAPGAGTKPQTRAFPGTDDTAFRNAMADLWLAVTTGKPDYARPAFFPVTAYEQVKAIADPESDWRDRLWYDFTLDVAAAHDLVGHEATLVRVVVPAQYATWIYPGACYNSLGYWHVPGARVVYRMGSHEGSFGIASLISWRGVWYVVHFGAVERSVATGVVDDPEGGDGVPGPPGGC